MATGGVQWELGTFEVKDECEAKRFDPQCSSLVRMPMRRILLLKT